MIRVLLLLGLVTGEALAQVASATLTGPLWPPVKSPRYRMSVGDPLLLEEVLCSGKIGYT